MILYRIAKCIYANDLSGSGARLYGGRWNSLGKSMVYLASSRSLAVLEVLVHLSPTIFPGDFCISEIEVPDNSILTMDVNSLPVNWQDISSLVKLKQLGDDFIKRQNYLLMKVPSAIVAKEFNYLLNPQHPAMTSVKVVSKLPFSFDERLVGPL
jgi:RES domain-containing protein